MDKVIKSRLRLTTDTQENWNNNNPVLLSGEMIIVTTDTGIRMKVGDGSKQYSELPFSDEELLKILSASCVVKEQGEENSGKLLGIDESGAVVPVDKKMTWGELAGKK